MQTQTLTFFHDPGHGWLQVPLTLVVDAGVSQDISLYSYTDKKFAYLEEDLDMTIFLNAAKEMGMEFTIEDQYQDPTPIRDMRPYQDYRKHSITG
jgi:hypothetical protein